MPLADRIFKQQRRGENRKNTQPYDKSLKVKIAKEYLSKPVTLRQLQSKYGISHSLILKWATQYRQALEPFNLSAEKTNKAKLMGRRKKQPEVPVFNEYERLRRELEETKLKNAALEKMIDLAETELGIEIRKKSNTKQSNG